MKWSPGWTRASTVTSSDAYPYHRTPQLALSFLCKCTTSQLKASPCSSILWLFRLFKLWNGLSRVLKSPSGCLHSSLFLAFVIDVWIWWLTQLEPMDVYVRHRRRACRSFVHVTPFSHSDVALGRFIFDLDGCFLAFHCVSLLSPPTLKLLMSGGAVNALSINIVFETFLSSMLSVRCWTLAIRNSLDALSLNSFYFGSFGFSDNSYSPRVMPCQQIRTRSLLRPMFCIRVCCNRTFLFMCGSQPLFNIFSW